VVEVVVVEVVRGAVEFGATLGALFGRGAFGAMLGALFGRLVGATLGALFGRFGRENEPDDIELRPLENPPAPELRPPPLELPPLASATPDNTSAAHNTVSLKIFIYIFLVSMCILQHRND
jgi:hypothetical protein